MFRKTFLLISVLIFSKFISAQVELLAKVNENLFSHFQTETPFYFTSSQVFSVMDEKLYHINPTTKSRELVSTNTIRVRSSYATPEALYFIVQPKFSEHKFQLFKIDNSLVMSEVYLFEGGNTSSNAFLYGVGEHIYFHIRIDAVNKIFKLDPNSNAIEEITTYENTSGTSLLSSNSNFIIYMIHSGNSRKIFKIEDEQVNEIIEGEYIPKYFSGTNNAHYLSLLYPDSICTYYKYNNLSKTFNLYMIDTVPNRTFETIIPHGNYFVLSSATGPNAQVHFKGIENAGILQVSTQRIQIKTEYVTSSTLFTPANARTPLASKNYPLFTYTNNQTGGEIYRINAEDSIELYQDFYPGKWGSFAFEDCNMASNNELNTFSNFSHNNKDYAVLTNGNDEHFYLYEVSEAGYHSIFRLQDHHRTIKFIPQNEFLYYFVLDQIDRSVKLYRVRWSTMNDQQPLVKNFNEEAWSTQFAYLRSDEICSHLGINFRALDIYANDNSETILSLVNIYHADLFRNVINETKNNTQILTNINHTIFKYSKFGELLWATSVGEKSKMFQEQDRVIPDRNGDVHVFGTFFKKSFFGNDSLLTPGSARSYAKIDGKTGAIISKKVLFQTNYIDDTEFLDVVLGENNTIYLAGKYQNFSQDFGDTTLISQTNFQNFLAKYDANGNLIWIRNVHNNFTDVIGEIREMNFNETTNEIGIYFSQNSASFSCNDIPWKSEIIFFNSDGRETYRKGMDGRFKHFGGSFSFGKGNSAIISGAFEGEISNDVFNYFSEKDDQCFAPESYITVLDRNQNRFVSSATSSQSPIEFEHAVHDENYLYFVGRNSNNKKLTIVRFDFEGKYRGEKELNQTSRHYRIDLKNGYFSIALVMANNESRLKIAHTVFPFSSNNNTILTLARFKIDDWSYSSVYSPMDVKFIDEDLGLWAYPNPSYDKIQINFEDELDQFETYTVSDYMGRTVLSGDVPNQNFIVLSVENLEMGVYTAVFRGDQIKKSIKLMKMN